MNRAVAMGGRFCQTSSFSRFSGESLEDRSAIMDDNQKISMNTPLPRSIQPEADDCRPQDRQEFWYQEKTTE